MKRSLIILICLIMVIATCFTSCSSNKITKLSTNAKGELIAEYSDGSTQNFGIVNKSVVSAYINDPGQLIIKYSDGTYENLGRIVDEEIWRTRADKIYTVATVQYRSSPSMETTNNIVSMFPFKTELHRTATNGEWNQIKDSNGNTYYILSMYTTTNKNEVTFDDENKIVYANKDTYIYLYPNTESYYTKKVKIIKNTKLIYTGKNKTDTWARIDYNGTEYYCKLADISETETTTTTTIPVTGNPVDNVGGLS